jgi:DoxX-like family
MQFTLGEQGGTMETTVSRRALWAGRVLSALPVLVMGLSGVFKVVGALSGNPELHANWAKFGYPPGALLPIGVVELACALVYALPGTAVLGAILVTGYLGGAVATHVRASESVWVAPFLFGVLAWLGIFLRDPRLRALLPLRQKP